MLLVLGALLGAIVGVVIPIIIPVKYSIYVAVAILAAVDTVCGGFVATLEKKFDMSIFLSGFFLNAILAAVLTYIGEKMGIQLYLAAIVAFGNRLFLNFGKIRRVLIKRYFSRDSN